MSANRRSFLKKLGAVALLPTLPGISRTTAAAPANGGSHRILSCNIRVALDEDDAKGMGWPARRKICLQIIKEKNPDIIALQEVLRVQANDFKSYFPTHQLLGFDGPEMDAYPTGYHGIAKNPVLFSRSRYELLAAGTYWLSETPLVAGSKSWETARARHANWVRLRERKTGKEIRVVNLHLDHVSEAAKVQQAKMVVDESAQYQPDFAQLLAGDFNSKYNSPVFRSVREAGWKESYESIHGAGEAGFTGHAFQGTSYEKGPLSGRIDYIWYCGKLQPVSALIIKDAVNGKYPSDHFFMQADFILQ